jgi:pimeloyl-ACP methyl ester carboxylesterase
MTAALGADAYKHFVDAAEAAAKQEKPDLIQFTATLPQASAGQGIKIVMWPKAFLASWGPDSPKVADQIGRVKVPVLVIGGSRDPYLDKSGFDRLIGGIKDAKSIYYADGAGADHDFHGYEDRVANDVAQWLKAR